MKNIIYTLILLSILTAGTNKCFSQNYQSLFGDSSTTWNIILFGACDAVCSRTIFADGDTTISSNTYKVISRLSGVSSIVREDTVHGKVWSYDTLNNTEHLIMDLGLSLGDTFNLFSNNNVANPFIVDSVYYVHNKKHVRINAWTTICALKEKITFIEGSGTTAGFDYQRNLNGNSVPSYMLCQHKDGVKVSGNLLFMDSCTVCSVGIQEHNSEVNSVKVFPNPTINYLNIETNSIPSTNSYLTIYSLLGKKIISQKITDKLTTINVSDLHNGVYIVILGDRITNKQQMFIKE